jgi:hypothetical protein
MVDSCEHSNEPSGSIKGEEFLYANFEAFMVVMFQVQVLWIMMQCRVVVGYLQFRGPCCLHLRQHGPLKHQYPTTTLPSITMQKTSTSRGFLTS